MKIKSQEAPTTLPEYLAPTIPEKAKEKEVLSFGVWDVNKMRVGDVIVPKVNIDFSISITAIDNERKTIDIRGYRKKQSETVTFEQFQKFGPAYLSVFREGKTYLLEQPKKGSKSDPEMSKKAEDELVAKDQIFVSKRIKDVRSELGLGLNE